MIMWAEYANLHPWFGVWQKVEVRVRLDVQKSDIINVSCLDKFAIFISKPVSRYIRFMSKRTKIHKNFNFPDFIVYFTALNDFAKTNFDFFPKL